MGHEKLTEVSVSYFFIPMLHCCLGDIRDEIWYKKYIGESSKDCKSYGTIGLSFKLKLIVFSISQFYGSNWFGIMNSF